MAVAFVEVNSFDMIAITSADVLVNYGQTACTLTWPKLPVNPFPECE